ncbi:single-stranded DNA-binding protein [Nonomuraea rhizosphaerae]|uniref:single-stranded DNA-binding protein n=1 Tax=Nonomuraea rhizosphaerae TaxID=2665663 RepID=UPI001C5E23F4
MDRNEVVLVGRLSAAPEDKPMPSGATLTKWRLIVRRAAHNRRAGTATDVIPCATFDPETAAFVRGLKPRETMEVKGAFRCHIYGPTAAKIWRYEVEVTFAKAGPPDTAPPPKRPRSPRKPPAPVRIQRPADGPDAIQVPSPSGGVVPWAEMSEILASIPPPRPAPDLTQAR